MKTFEKYFVAVLTSGKTVSASQVLLADDTPVITSEKTFKLESLHSSD